MLVDIYLCNVIFSAVLSVIMNIAMVISVSYSRRLNVAYRVQMYISAGICLVYTAINVWANPSIASLAKDRAVLFVKGGFETSYEFGNLLLDIFVVLIMVTAIHPTIQFVYRYLHIVQANHKHRWEKPIFWLFALIPLFLVFSSAIFFCYELQPTEMEQLRYNITTYHMNIEGFTSFLVAGSRIATDPFAQPDTFHSDYKAFGAMFYMVLNMLLSSFVIIFTVVSIKHYLGKNPLSQNTMKLHKQLNKTLLAQALIPFTTIHLPFYISCVAPLFGWIIYYLQEYLPFLFSYYSVLMPFSVVYYCKDVRNVLLRCRKKSVHSLTTQSSSDDRAQWAGHRK